MEGGGFGFPFGGDPEDLMRGLREFAERQTEAVQESQREQFATLTLNTAVELTGAALKRIDVGGKRRRAGSGAARRDASALSRGGRAGLRCASGLHARALGPGATPAAVRAIEAIADTTPPARVAVAAACPSGV